jgi:hypothetical protein
MPVPPRPAVRRERLADHRRGGRHQQNGDVAGRLEPLSGAGTRPGGRPATREENARFAEVRGKVRDRLADIPVPGATCLVMSYRPP